MKDTFPGYYRPSEEEFTKLWENATFSFDANVLLGVYRYTPSTRENLTKIIEKLSPSIWLPYQAALEYQRNRLVVISEQADQFKKHLASLEQALEPFSKHPFLSPDDSSVYGERRAEILAQLKHIETIQPDLFANDSLRQSLDRLFAGRIGVRYTPTELEEKHKAAKIRFEAKVPPGYMDAEKKDLRQYGDVLVWFQLLDYAKDKKKPVVLISDDRKEDWWTRQSGKTIGPRPELIEEFKEMTGQQFYMYQSDQFVAFGQDHFGLKNEKAIEEVRQRSDEFDVERGFRGAEYSPRWQHDSDWSKSVEHRYRMGMQVLPIKMCGFLKLLLRHGERTGSVRIPFRDLLTTGVGLSFDDTFTLLRRAEARGYIATHDEFESGWLTHDGLEAARNCVEYDLNQYPDWDPKLAT